MKKDEYNYKILVVNFKAQHQELYEWLKKYCEKNGTSISHTVRELIKKFKETQDEE